MPIHPQCPALAANNTLCNCTYEPCPRKGNCCACLQYHLAMKQLPACAFPDEVERTYDRSFRRFVALHG
jgi:hypothetical protein